MALMSRVLPAEPLASLDAYEAWGGGEGLKAARKAEPAALIAEVAASGLRGRGGAGFPTATKWQTVAEVGAVGVDARVIVNAAEGEPGTFKDRMILRNNPYGVVEGALIAARAIGADDVVIALKASFRRESDRVTAAIAELDAAGWLEGTKVTVFGGPAEYLYGEETALLEALDGRPPFPRIAPPYREGLAGAPILVNNVETMANVPGILAHGADWFREVGTEESPGTIVCTVTGATVAAGVGEVAMGTPLRDVIDEVGRGPRGESVVAVMSGVAAPVLFADDLEAPVSHEGMAAAGSGLGSASFIVLDEGDDVTAYVAGASRFLAVESCGQCVPCKRDGLELADRLAALCRNEAERSDVEAIAALARTVSEEARCALARQHEAVVTGFLATFAEAVDAHVDRNAAAVDPALIAEVVDIEGERANLDEDHARKQPDWTFDETDSGKWPAESTDTSGRGGEP